MGTAQWLAIIYFTKWSLDISSTHLALYITIKVVSIIFPKLCFKSPWPCYNYQFDCFLIPSLFYPVSYPLFSGNHRYVLCICECISMLSVYLFSTLDFSYKWNHMIFVFFVWLISLGIITSSSIHVVLNGKILFFFKAEQYSIVAHFYPLINWWALGLLPYLGYCK